MKDQFSDIVDVSFTARMEESLDSVGMGEQDWKLLEHFYKPFAENLERAEKDVERIKIPVEETDVICELCGSNMVIKTGRFGRF